jgi:hypothetical protein
MPFSDTPALERKKVTGSAAVNAAQIPGAAEALQDRSPTSIHVLVSAILKLSRKAVIPPGRRAFRGLGRMLLGTEWFSPDKRGARSGVEFGFMSTTLSREVALEYSGVKIGGIGTVLEFDIGAIDCGAQLGSLSQYPGSKRRFDLELVAASFSTSHNYIVRIFISCLSFGYKRLVYTPSCLYHQIVAN